MSAGSLADDVAYMIDQSHNIEPKLEAMLLSVLNCQTAYAKALIVDFDKLRSKQQAGDVLGAHRVLMDAYETDVRPLLGQMRTEIGRNPDPMAAYEADDYAKKVGEARGSDEISGSGYPG